MTALDDLQRSLSRAVDAGAAADPARVGENPGRVGRPRSRRGWHVFAAILLAGGATTGALAATGQLRIVKEPRPEFLVMSGGMGMPDLRPIAPPTILPLRVTDPAGGPPWTLRVYRLRGEAACVQAGQVYEGQFGTVETDRERGKVFRLIPTAMGMGVRCARLREGRFPVVSAVRTVRINGGSVFRAGCSSSDSRDPRCSVNTVQVVRFGLLGPGARSATFIRSDGRRATTQPLGPDSGGAYLFVEDIDPAPWKRSLDVESEIRRKADARFPRVPYGSIPKADRPAEDRRWKDRVAYVQRLSKAARGNRRNAFMAMQRAAESVEATFADGSTRIVAGRGNQGGPLPGVKPAVLSPPKVEPTRVTVEYVNRIRSVRIKFAAPVAIDRYGESYFVSVRGPVAPACGRREDSMSKYHYRVPRKGMDVLVRLPAPWQGVSGMSRTGWCPGARYIARVKHHAGPIGHDRGVNQRVGEASFVAR